MRHGKVQKRQIGADRIYSNVLVAKVINRIMRDGKKSIAEKLVYDTFDQLQAKGHDPLGIFLKAIGAISPKVEIKARRVGGANYQVPIEVRKDRQEALALSWIIDAARNRSNKDYHSFSLKLAAELLDASENKGEAAKKRDNTLRQADANKAFAHFRW